MGAGQKESSTLNAKIWQMVQSSKAKGKNLEHDFDEIAAKVQEPGWRDGKRQTRCWVENRRRELVKAASLPLLPGTMV